MGLIGSLGKGRNRMWRNEMIRDIGNLKKSNEDYKYDIFINRKKAMED